jgi:hypothetical protein
MEMLKFRSLLLPANGRASLSENGHCLAGEDWAAITQKGKALILKLHVDDHSGSRRRSKSPTTQRFVLQWVG